MDPQAFYPIKRGFRGKLCVYINVMKTPRAHITYRDLTPDTLNTLKQVSFISEETSEQKMNKRFRYYASAKMLNFPAVSDFRQWSNAH